MNHDYVVAYLALSLPFFIIFLLMLICWEGGMPFSIWNRFKCRTGKHKFKNGKTNLYFCRTCKKRKDFPVLELVVGKKQMKGRK